mmetsp:Transcript_35076/g.54449  ORF Transcript_35076/g.54449 Transcript_35076/m.54449 type:complete len:581 (+) Transcript_35076:104-1846(+)
MFGFEGQITDDAGFPAPPGTEEHWSESCLYELKRLKTFTANRLDHLENVFEQHSGQKVPPQEKTEAKEMASMKATVEYLNSAFMVLQNKSLQDLEELSRRIQELEQSSQSARLPGAQSLKSFEGVERKFATLTKRQETFELQTGTNNERLTARIRILQDSIKSVQETVSSIKSTPRDHLANGKDVAKRIDAMEVQIHGLETSLSNISKKPMTSPSSPNRIGSPIVTLRAKEVPGERDTPFDDQRNKDLIFLKKASAETRANVKLLAEAAAAMDIRINALEKGTSTSGSWDIPDIHALSANLPQVSVGMVSARSSLESLGMPKGETIQNDVQLRIDRILSARRSTNPISIRSKTVSEASRSPSPSEIQHDAGATPGTALRYSRPMVPAVDLVRLRAEDSIPGRATPPSLITPTKASASSTSLRDAPLSSVSGGSHRDQILRGSRSVEIPPGESARVSVTTPRVPPEGAVAKGHSVSIPFTQRPSEAPIPAHIVGSPAVSPKLSPTRVSQAPAAATIRRYQGVSTPSLSSAIPQSPPQSPTEDIARARRAVLIKPPSSRTLASPQGSVPRTAASLRPVITPR